MALHRFGSFCFGQLKRILVLPDSKPSPPLSLWAACISDSCEEWNGHFAEGAMWTPAGRYLVLAHNGLSESGSPEGSSPAPLALKDPLITLNYIGQPLPGGGRLAVRAELN